MKKGKSILVFVVLMSLLCATVSAFAAEDTAMLAKQCEEALAEYGVTVNWLEHDYRYTQVYSPARQVDGLYHVLLLDEFRPDRFAEDGIALVDLEGKLRVPPEYDAIRQFDEGLGAVAKVYERGRDNQHTRWGFVELSSGQLKIPLDYDEVGVFSEGLVAVRRPGDDLRESWGYLDRTGSMKIPYTFIQAGEFRNGVAVVAVYVEDGQGGSTQILNGLIDTSGNWIWEPVHEVIVDSGEGLYSVRNDQGMYGVCDISGNLVFPYISEEPVYFYDSVASIRQNEKYGLADKSGNLLMPCEYDQLLYNEYGGDLIYVAKGSHSTYFLWGAVDKTGKEIIPVQYPNVMNYGKDLTPLENQQGKWGVVDSAGKIVLPFVYDESISITENGDIRVWEGGASRLLNRHGQPLFTELSGEYQDFVGFFEGIWIVEDESGHYGGLDKDGNVVVPFLFSQMTRIENGRALVGIQSGGEYEDATWADRAGILTLPGAKKEPANQTIKVLYNGVEIAFDQMPHIENGRTLVPMRAIFEAAGATVEWDGDAMRVTGKKVNPDGSLRTVELVIGEDTAFVDGGAVTLDVPARLSAGRTMVPLRFVTEKLSDTAEVKWDENVMVITITDPAV